MYRSGLKMSSSLRFKKLSFSLFLLLVLWLVCEVKIWVKFLFINISQTHSSNPADLLPISSCSPLSVAGIPSSPIPSGLTLTKWLNAERKQCSLICWKVVFFWKQLKQSFAWIMNCVCVTKEPWQHLLHFLYFLHLPLRDLLENSN